MCLSKQKLSIRLCLFMYVSVKLAHVHFNKIFHRTLLCSFEYSILKTNPADEWANILYLFRNQRQPKNKSIAKYLIWHCVGKCCKEREPHSDSHSVQVMRLGAGIPCRICAERRLVLGLYENCICMSIAFVYLALLFLTLPQGISNTDRDNVSAWRGPKMCGWFDSSDIMEIFSQAMERTWKS